MRKEYDFSKAKRAKDVVHLKDLRSSIGKEPLNEEKLPQVIREELSNRKRA